MTHRGENQVSDKAVEIEIKNAKENSLHKTEMRGNRTAMMGNTTANMGTIITGNIIIDSCCFFLQFPSSSPFSMIELAASPLQ